MPTEVKGRPIVKFTRNFAEETYFSYYIQGSGTSELRPGPAVVFAHGNGETAYTWLELLDTYYLNGISVLILEYRGYVCMDGKPSETALVDDAEYFLDELKKRKEVDKSRIIYHGRSIGTGILVRLSKRELPATLVLESSFKNLSHFAKKFLAPSFLILDNFDNESIVGSLDCPILIIHGNHDSFFPIEHPNALHEITENSTLVILNCGHNDCPRGQVGNNIKEYLTTQGLMQPPNEAL